MSSFEKELLKTEDYINQTADFIFNQADIDKSGLIEKNEFKNLLIDFTKNVEIHVPTDEEIEEIISNFDEDQDGKFSKTEFRKFVELIFDVIYKSIN